MDLNKIAYKIAAKLVTASSQEIERKIVIDVETEEGRRSIYAVVSDFISRFNSCPNS
ncbi:MAG: hypothetical protein NWE95_06205 [Candidatus Bathyarchaeota archaeon]|nr:hypothetical protein [Candidatus Bathyarchaeota archaeon]